MAGDEGRTYRRWPGFVAMAVVLAVLVGVPSIWFASDGFTGPAENDGAKPNLQTGLTGARTFYNANGTFLGLMHPASSTVSSIQDIVGGNVRFVSGPSTAWNVVSTDVGDGGAFVVFTTFQNTGVPDCWGILDLAQPVARTVLGISKGSGTFFFVIRRTTPSGCDAATVRSVSAYSTAGFPSG